MALGWIVDAASSRNVSPSPANDPRDGGGGRGCGFWDTVLQRSHSSERNTRPSEAGILEKISTGWLLLGAHRSGVGFPGAWLDASGTALAKAAIALGSNENTEKEGSMTYVNKRGQKVQVDMALPQNSPILPNFESIS